MARFIRAQWCYCGHELTQHELIELKPVQVWHCTECECREMVIVRINYF